jgi:hypothetical protein
MEYEDIAASSTLRGLNHRFLTGNTPLYGIDLRILTN